MNARKILHDIVEKLPESELITAARILTALEQPADPLRMLLENAADDDEPFDPADVEGIDDEPRIPHGIAAKLAHTAESARDHRMDDKGAEFNPWR